jgi:signal transduction histidine kinase
MTILLQAIQDVVCLAFLALSILTASQWLRQRDASTGLMALAIGSLGLVTLIGRFTSHTGINNAFLANLSLVAFCFSGYALLEFRGTFLALGRPARLLAIGVLAVTAVIYIAIGPPPAGRPPSTLQSFAVLALIIAWVACVVEPIVRFWLAARRLPAVQATRLRSLAIGYALLVVILLGAGSGGAFTRSVGFGIATQLVALLAVPALYAAFSPPAWLRRIWREPEEEALRMAIEDLLLFSTSRAEMANKALEWAVRLVGADAGFVVDADGSILASKGISEDAANRLGTRLGREDGRPLRRLTEGENATALIVPLRLDAGDGSVVVLSGPYTPFFGADEARRLKGYATAVAAGLDRTVLTAKITALERTKTEFLSLASHELRGPLTVIRGYLSMLEAGTLGEISESARKVLPILSAKAAEANSLVGQMVEAARLEEGRLELKPERVDLRHLCETVLDMVRPIVDNGHLLRIEAESPVPVEVDPERIRTIVGNLLSNAIKYSPDGGEVTCRVMLENGIGKIMVIDQGLGIAAEDMPRLFTRFGRIATKETAQIGGTGLGLYLSRELARLHGGDLTAESSPGQGSTFTLAIPLSAGS